MARLLPYDAYYENSRGEVLRLDRLPFVLRSGDIFDAEWRFTKGIRPLGEGGRLLAAKRSDKEKSFTVSIAADTANQLSAHLERMSAIFDCDVAALQAGRLWINGQYMTCWCSARVKELSCDFVTNASVRVVVHPETPVWCREVSCRIAQNKSNGGHSYPYSYPYRYGDSRSAARIVNSHFAPCPMRITFHGPAQEPAVYINGGRVGVNISLAEDESAVIDQRSGEVYMVNRSGEKTNCFDARTKNGLVFRYAPSGESIVVLDNGTDADIVLIEQRSEPTWTLN